MARGMTSSPTSRSATARETMSQFDGVLSLRTMLTAVQTSMLPTIVPMTIRQHASAIIADAHAGYASRPATPPPSLELLLLFAGVIIATARWRHFRPSMMTSDVTVNTRQLACSKSGGSVACRVSILVCPSTLCLRVQLCAGWLAAPPNECS